MSEDLKPCPFCGGAAELDPLQGFRALGTGAPGNRTAVYCTECSADIGLCQGDVPELDDETRTSYVVGLWNRRMIPAARYRWLRDAGDSTWRPFGLRYGYSAAWADAEIDKAMSVAAQESKS